MSKSGWDTYCFGRFLVDLPPQVKIGEGYTIWGSEVETVNAGSGEFSALVDQREHELKSSPHDAGGSLFIERVSHANGSASILSYERARSKGAMWLDAYLVADGGRGAFKRSALVDPARRQSAIEFAGALAAKMRFREPLQIPTESGFCIDGGYIAGNEYMAESFEVGFTMPQHPGMHFSISSSTGAEEDSLLERVGGFFQTEVMGPVAGIKTLRKGRRRIGHLAGEEYSVVAVEGGQRGYGFIWEFQGRDESLSEPNVNVGLSVLERDPDDDGNPPPPAFESDEQALQLWDTILESIRLRPGAV